MKELTERQREVLNFIRNCINAHYPPTVREVADHFDISVKGAYDHLGALKKKNYLRMGRGSRTMEVIKSNDAKDPLDVLEIPILGSVAAGIPINVEENLEGVVPVHTSLLKGTGPYFALKVHGDSMKGVGILDGDMAIIQQQNTARNGEIVVVQLDESTTLKRFYLETSRIRLQPENEAFKPIFRTLDSVRILGKLVHLCRSY
jgi:repressor LexA